MESSLACVASGWVNGLLYLCGFLVLLKVYLWQTKGMCKSGRRLDGKTAIVTGGTSGIGRETALDFARRNARVVLPCLDLEEGNETKEHIIRMTGNRNVAVYRMNLASLASVREFVAQFLDREERLDILVNNAGVGFSTKPRTEDSLNSVLQINHFGHFLLTNLLLGVLKKSAPSRIVFVSSPLHFISNFDIDNLHKDTIHPFIEQYACSKLCNALTSFELAERLKDTGVTCNSVSPGAVCTPIYDNLPMIMKILFKVFIIPFSKSPTEGAQTTIHVAVTEEVEGVSGKYFSDCKVDVPSRLSQNKQLAKKVWEMSERLVKCEEKKTE